MSGLRIREVSGSNLGSQEGYPQRNSSRLSSSQSSQRQDSIRTYTLPTFYTLTNHHSLSLHHSRLQAISGLLTASIYNHKQMKQVSSFVSFHVKWEILMVKFTESCFVTIHKCVSVQHQVFVEQILSMRSPSQLLLLLLRGRVSK
jgi:hypothetical protein